MLGKIFVEGHLSAPKTKVQASCLGLVYGCAALQKTLYITTKL
jgi:hypothetical protein